MKLYKYRSIENLDRDLDLLKRNCFWASIPTNLDDEKEFIFNHKPLSDQLRLLSLMFPNVKSLNNVRLIAKDVFEHISHIGVFSLSKSPIINTMWSFYASQWKGYCLIFDSDLLKKSIDANNPRLMIEVQYADKVPQVNTDDLDKKNILLRKMIGTKERNWECQQEIRIITESPNEQYFLPSALEGIIFGTKTEEYNKAKIMSALADRTIDIYQLNSQEDTYDYSLVKKISHHKKVQLDQNTYYFENQPAPLIDNFYIKSFIEFKDHNSIKDFLIKFKNDHAERNCNIYLHDRMTDESKFKNWSENFDYLSNHLIAEIPFDSDEVIFHNINKINTEIKI